MLGFETMANIAIMENKRDTTIEGLGLRGIFGFYWNHGKYNGNYDSGFRV